MEGRKRRQRGSEEREKRVGGGGGREGTFTEERERVKAREAEGDR